MGTDKLLSAEDLEAIASDWETGNSEECRTIRALLTHIRLEQAPRWQLMDKRPDDMDCFLAAVEVHNRRTGKTSWDIHLVTLDDETGEINEDTGWTLEDYTWFAPRPSPPTGIGDPNLLSRDLADDKGK